jgi:2-polyprenyl-6-methoxyphenol hydroxylase-like FAD-dependent oxidoreductase
VLRATVIGAGIGGLAAAIALRRGGCDVTVHEADESISELGAGISIWPNGIRALRALGLDALVDDSQVPRVSGALRRADGTVLADFGADVIAQRYGEPLIGLHRRDLHEALLEAFGHEGIRRGSRLIDIEDDVLRFADGDSDHPDLAVGADGLRSVARGSLIADVEPRDSAIVAFRGVSPAPPEVPAGEWWGEESVAGLLPLRGDLVYWYVAHRVSEAAPEPERSELEHRTREFAAPLREIVAATPTEEVLLHRLFDRPPERTWSSQRTTLLADGSARPESAARALPSRKFRKFSKYPPRRKGVAAPRCWPGGKSARGRSCPPKRRARNPRRGFVTRAGEGSTGAGVW